MSNTNTTDEFGRVFSFGPYCNHQEFFFRTKTEADWVSFESRTEKVCVACNSTMMFTLEDLFI